MTASTLKGAIKGTLKGILNTAAPVFSRRSAMDSASARETLLGFSPCGAPNQLFLISKMTAWII